MENQRRGDHKLMNIKHCDQLASITYEQSTRTTQVTGTANSSTTFFKQQSK